MKLKLSEIDTRDCFRSFERNELFERLKEDIKIKGQQSPGLAVRRESGFFLLDGLRRYTALQELGIEDMEVNINW